MANKKFSEFTLKTDSANVDFVVGYDGSDNVRIAPSNLSSGGASSLNGLSDVLIDSTSAYFINIPSGLSGNPADNLVIGNSAGNSLTTGLGNIAIGNQALSSGTTAQKNVAIGNECFPLVTGNSNVGVGYFSGKLSTAASNNTFIGNTAGQQNSQGSGNTFVGKGAGFWNTTLSDNAYIGMNSGSVLGQKNVSLGVRSLGGTFAAVSESVGVGYEAGGSNQATQVTFVGSQAGRANTAAGNVAIGYQSGYSNTSGSENTNIGYKAGYSNTISGSNTKVGYEAAYHNTGQQTAAFGYRALFGSAGSSSGRYNSAFGREAGVAVTSGEQNTLLGASAGKAITTGSGNTVIGVDAAFNSLISGGNNIVIGKLAAPSATSVSNEITLGDPNIATLRCQVQTISALSDSRDKTNVQPSPYGLDLISQLQPVTFDWNMRDGAKVGQKDLGFIAQELQEVDDENLQLVYDNNPDRLEASYGRLIPVLVQAIKDLKAEVELLKA